MSHKILNPCHECEETEYVGKNGVYYCTTCGTKYQDQHDMEAEMDVTNRNINHTKIRFVKKQRLAHDLKNTQSAKKYNKYEMFQILLKHQVEALIKLGAHPRLKDVVFELWKKYLAVIKIAFYDKDDKKYVEKSPYKETAVKKEENSSNKVSSKNEEEDMELDDMEETKNDKQDDIAETLADDTDKHVPHRLRIKLPYTLALCYLGLIYTNPLTTFMDLLRWAKQFKIPFCNAIDYLSKDADLPHKRTFLAHADPGSINSSTIPYLQMDVRYLALHLNLEDSPPVPLRMFVQKYTSMLNLPDDLHSISSKLVGSTSVRVLNMKRKPILFLTLEATVVSYVVVILKLLFGLDGHTEREFCFCSRKLATNIQNRHTLFNLEEWLVFMKDQVLRQEVPIDPIISGSNRENDKGVSHEWVDNRKTKLDELLEAWKGCSYCTDTNSISQSIYAPLVTLSRIWNRRKMENQSTGTNFTSNYLSETSLKQNYFRDSSLQHILHPDCFLKSLDQFRLASLCDVLRDRRTMMESENISGSLQRSENVSEGLKASSSTLNSKEAVASELKKTSETIRDSAEYGSLSNQSTVGRPIQEIFCHIKTETAHSNCIETNDVTRLQNFLKTNLRTTKVTNVEQFDDIVQQIIFTRNTLHSNYTVCPKHTTNIYDEILTLCSNLIFTKPNVLHRLVQKTEKQIFEENKTDSDL